MAGLFGAGANAYKPTVYTGIQLQTSAQGIAVPVYYGTTRGGDNLIWYAGFVATKVSSGGKGGALAAAAGKGSGNTYKYSANVILAVGEGPIQGFGQVWASKTPTTMAALGLTAFTGTYPQAAWGFVSTNYAAQARPYTGLAYLGGSSYQLGSSAELPGHNFEVYGFYSQRVVYTTAVIPGAPYQITVGNRAWANGSTVSLWVNDQGVSGYAHTGGAPAAGQYTNTAGLYTFNVADTGKTVVIAWTGSGQDADPSLVVTDLLSNSKYGVGFPAANIGELVTYTENDAIPGGPFQITVANAATFDDNLSVYHVATDTLYTCVASSPGPLQYSCVAGLYTFNAADSGKTIEICYAANAGLATFQSYCWAAGFFISPAYTTQQAASAALDEIAKYTNSEIVNSSGAIKLVPRGDKVISANGHTYTPPLATVADLTDDDLQTKHNDGGISGQAADDPVIITRRKIADQKNVYQVEALDRANQYNVAMVESTDQAAVDQYGRRTTGSQQAHLFCDPTIARAATQLLLQREALRNQFTFTLDARWVWLDPMDLVSITDTRLGLTSQDWVRILAIEEQTDGALLITAEEYANGIANGIDYAYGQGAGYAANYNIDPGSINTPIIFEPSVQLSTNTGLEIWGAFSGANSNWGGADIWVSSDGTTYNYVGRQWGAARQGVLSAIFPLGADPDTVNTASVDLTESFGALTAGTNADADAGNTQMIVDSELFSFSAATLTATYKYNLGTYLRRGQFGTTIAAHAINAPVARLDEQIFTIPYDKDQITKTIYVKACSFNLWGGGLQDISVATAYAHVIVGPPLPGTVTNFAVTQQGGPVIFTWTDLPDFVLKGYDILYSDLSGSVSTAVFLTEASRATEMTHANVPPGTWIFYIRGHDLADQVGPASTVTFTVKNFNFIISQTACEPDWFGTLTNAVKHPSGVLVPQGQNASSTYGWEVFDQYVPDPFATPNFVSLEVDSGADGDMRAVLTDIVVPATAYGETGSPAHVGQIKWKTSSGAYNAFQDWISGTITARYVTMKVTLDTAIRSYITNLDLTLDGTPVTQTQTVTIDALGTAITWQTPFRNTPVVQVTPASSAATGGSAESVTNVGALVKLWNGTVEVGGPAYIAATGTEAAMGINPVGTWGQTTWSVSTASTAAFDYKTQVDQNFIVMSRFGPAFAPHEQSTGDMTIALSAGFLYNGSALTEVAAQNTSAFAAPTASPRIDRVVVDQFTGVASIVQGTAAQSPVAPDLPYGVVPVARISLAVGVSRIGNSMITDERIVWGQSLPGNYQEFTTTGTSTWTKPSGFSTNAAVIVMAWGPGGSGASTANNEGGGGGGGACVLGIYRLSDLAGTVSVIVAAGAIPGNLAISTGVTLFGSLTAYAGVGGSSASVVGGAGAGTFGNGSTSTISGGPPLGGVSGSGVLNSVFGGGASTSSPTHSGDSVWGGAGGGQSTGSAGYSIYGGAGGAGYNAGSSGAAGISLVGGNGGAAFVAGSAPSGGGGYGAAGARGEVRVWVLR